MTAERAHQQPTSRRKTAWIAAAAAVVFILVIGFGVRPRYASLIGGPAPDFTLRLFDGGEMSLADQRGTVVLINFWASWCDPCREEAPVLERLWQEYRDRGVVFVGVTVNDRPEESKAFIEEFGLTFPNGDGSPGDLPRLYRITGVPETFLVAPDGRLVRRYIGPIQAAAVRAALNELLQESSGD